MPGRFYKAETGNISRSGLCFESDQTLFQGEKIYIGNNRPRSAKNISEDYAGIEIELREDLKNSSFWYGYGANFLDPDNSLLKSIDITEITGKARGDGGRYKNDPREHIREIYRKEKNFTSKNREFKGSIANISRGGAFIRTKNKFALGQIIQLDIRRDKTCKALRLKGWVVRLSPNGVGVKFDRRIRRDRRKKADRRVRRKTIKKEHRS